MTAPHSAPVALARRATRHSLLAATALAGGLLATAAPTMAVAQPVTGLYVGVAAGANWVGETSLQQSGQLTAAARQQGWPANGGNAEFNTGVAALGALGWGFGNGLRSEIEFSYRYNDIDKITGFGAVGASGALAGSGGDQQTYGLMFNLLYDFHIAGAPWVVPYLGAGVGMGWTRWQTSNGTRTNPALGTIRLNIDDDAFNFAYQAMAGAAFPIAAVPGLALTTEFRFFGTLQNKFDVSTQYFTPAGLLTRTARGNVEADNYNYAVMVGLRYAFGVTPPPPPPPPPAAAPAPAPARTYLVFFDWDRADLTDRARQIIAEAAQNSTRVQTTRIEVAGHADRSGSPEYNMRLSRRRADNVAAELVRRGVNRSVIHIEAFGESRPLVPTADGVREPQNRRVEIVLR